ncbi:hypothetical protein LTR37_002613 [Vermiconidia calcicola]|uniref:Uncharacterized protein n=1 Tax=Vermiconidia calcicola TaxID=1690605 RepID=A0ACC3NTL0_9PEZI|nr:hypothetical protein LTR37_002613 [Vermiconidia calcicola]
MILKRLPILDILSVYQVNSSLRAAIDGSPKLQMELCLRPAPPNGHLKLAFLPSGKVGSSTANNNSYRNSSFMTISYGLKPLIVHEAPAADHDPAELRAYSPASLRDQWTSSTRWCSLPAHVHLPASNQNNEDRFDLLFHNPHFGHPTFPATSTPEPTISSEQGLTVGDLYECTKKLMEEHRWCPNAPPALLDDDGMVHPHVLFSGDVALQPGDPALQRELEAEAKEKRDVQRHKVRIIQLNLYTKAKQDGWYPLSL